MEEGGFGDTYQGAFLINSAPGNLADFLGVGPGIPYGLPPKVTKSSKSSRSNQVAISSRRGAR